MCRACSKHGERRISYRVLVEKRGRKWPLGKPRLRWEDNIKMDLRERGWDGMHWINIAQDRVQSWIDFRDMLTNSWVAEQLLGSEDGLSSMELVTWASLWLMIVRSIVKSQDCSTKTFKGIESKLHQAITLSTKSYPCNRPWRPMGLWDVEGLTLSRQSAQRWR
jgi:hypothetical protein